MKRVQIDHPNLYDLEEVNPGSVVEAILDYNGRWTEDPDDHMAEIVCISHHDMPKVDRPELAYYPGQPYTYVNPSARSCPIRISQSLPKGRIWISRKGYLYPR